MEQRNRAAFHRLEFRSDAYVCVQFSDACSGKKIEAPHLKNPIFGLTYTHQRMIRETEVASTCESSVVRAGKGVERMHLYNR